METLTIAVYPLFGGWRAECKSCGAYGVSASNKYTSQIAEAIENLSKNQNVFSTKSNKCQHHYGSYKPRVVCVIDYKHLRQIKDCTFATRGCERFPSILIDNKYALTVINAKDLTHEWSAYSFVRFSQLMEQREKAKEKHEQLKQELQAAIEKAHEVIRRQAEEAYNLAPITQTVWSTPTKYLVYLILFIYMAWIILLIAAASDTQGARELLERLDDGCSHKLCL